METNDIGATVDLPVVGASLALADVYAQVDDLPRASRKPPEAAGSAPTLA